MSLLFRLKEKNAHTIFGAIADELKKDGVELIEATPWLKSLMPQAGFHLGPELSDEKRADVEFGFRIAREVSRLEIGQTVVVKKGAVLAVEGFEGTDKCLARGGELAGKDGGAVAVKVAKVNHDMRFDIPCVGCRHWKPVPTPEFPCWYWKLEKLYCWNRRLAGNWQKKVKSPS